MTKSNTYATIGTLLFGVGVMLLLLFVMMPTIVKPIEDELGVMVSFGDELGALGTQEFLSQIAHNNTVTTSMSAEEDLLTQEAENTPTIPPKQENIQKQNFKKTSDNVKPKENPTKSQQQVQESQRTKDDLVKKSFENNSGVIGDNQSDKRKGNPAGRGTSNGHDWSLSGRGLVGSITTPSYTSNVEGRITVVVRVNEAGKVTRASVTSPTNISDKKTRDATLTAAKKITFTPGSSVSLGHITYNFKLK